jgi:hypothetical protein
MIDRALEACLTANPDRLPSIDGKTHKLKETNH